MTSRFSGFNGFINQIRNSSYIGFLKPNEGAVTSYKRLGRGASSGLGKTSGRGQKGQKARGSVPRWLEGGQTPYYKRFPIIGFKRPHRREYNDINLEQILEFWAKNRIPLQAGDTLTIKVMRESGMITGSLKDGVKILSRGADIYNVPLNIEASQGSELAIKTVENLGHKFTARYFTKLSLHSHVNPDRFILKKGYVPLSPRPIHRRDIEYYSNPEKRGYLLEDTSLLLDYMKSEKKSYVKAGKRTSLERQSDGASKKRFGVYEQNGVVNLSDL